jgi:hypothetical protein
MSYMISYSLAVELSEGYFGDDDDHSSDEDYGPSVNLSQHDILKSGNR